MYTEIYSSASDVMVTLLTCVLNNNKKKNNNNNNNTHVAVIVPLPLTMPPQSWAELLTFRPKCTLPF